MVEEAGGGFGDLGLFRLGLLDVLMVVVAMFWPLAQPLSWVAREGSLDAHFRHGTVVVMLCNLCLLVFASCVGLLQLY